MERLNRQLNPPLGGVRHDGADPVEDHLSRPVEVTIGRWPTHQHEHVRTQLTRFVYRAKIVVDPSLAFRVSRSGKEAAPAQARDAQPIRSQAPPGFLHTDL